MGLLPNTNNDMEPSVSLIHNDSGQFLDRWVRLEVNFHNSSPWLSELGSKKETLEYPVRHGEGKFIFGSEVIRRELSNNQRIALRYLDNPNGSVDDVAGITDGTGRVLGLMPHPEAFLYSQQHPRWTRERVEEPTAGLRLFQGAVKSLG
jgi:phosphoribosylformylglycinamidine synthase